MKVNAKPVSGSSMIHPLRDGVATVSVILVVATAIHLFFNTASLCRSGSYAMTIPTAEASDCESRLEDMERVWEIRKDARIKKTGLDGAKWLSGRPRDTWDFWEPEAVCFDEERFGGPARYQSWGDGPKFVCGLDRIIEKAKNPDQGGCLVYSVGSNNEIAFEVAVSEIIGRGRCEVHTFDPTVETERYVGKNYSQFHPWGLGKDGKHTEFSYMGRRKFNYTEISLASVVAKLGHEGRVIDILKIDCEGCEYEAVTQAFQDIADGLIKVDQMQVELHLQGTAGKAAIMTLFEKADSANMRIFHKEHNHLCGHSCVEYAFVSNLFLRKANRHYVCGY